MSREKDISTLVPADISSALFNDMPPELTFEAGGADAAAVMADNRDLGHDGDAHVAAEFVEHEHVRGADQFERRGPLQRLLEHGVDAVFGIAHGFVRAAAEAIKDETAIGGRGASGLHDRLGTRNKIKNASFKFLLAQALGRARGDQHGLNAKLAEAFGKQISG